MARAARLAAAQRLLAPAPGRGDRGRTPGPAEPFALIIGNAGYKNVSRLPNPPSDAKAVAQTFQSIGFRKVVLVEDRGAREPDFRTPPVQGTCQFGGLGRDLLRRARHGNRWYQLRRAGRRQTSGRPRCARRGDFALAVSRRGRRRQAVETDHSGRVSGQPVPVQNEDVGSVSLDQPRAGAKIEPEGSTLVAYAAKNGQLAMDGKGANSPFVTALVSRMLTPGLEIRKVFGLVRDDVLAATRRQQEPSIYGSLGGDDYIINPD